MFHLKRPVKKLLNFVLQKGLIVYSKYKVKSLSST